MTFQVLIAGIVGMAVLGNAAARADGDFEVLQDVEVGRVGGQMMHVDIERPLHPPYRPMPVIFTMHAGGWKDGTYHNCFGWGNLATAGFMVVSIEYHPISATEHWPVQLQDCLRAVRWMRVNAARYNADPNHFAAYGTSAGGHLAACIAVYGDDPKYADPAYPGVSAEVQAVVSGDGPLDILTTENNHTNAKVKWNEETLAGGTPAQQPEAWNEITLSRHVSGQLPPFFIWHGEKDDVIPVEGTVHFVDALKSAGVPVEFIIVKNGGHTAFYPVDKTQPIVPDGKTLISKTEAFLKKYLVVPGK
jgi:acetyl esterase/lipase